MDNITYVYAKKRRNFGRQPIFCVAEAELVDSINPNPALFKEYCLRNPVNHDVQVYKPKSEHEINTIQVRKMPHGINHAEGGWPKEIHFNNEEETLRYRRRIEREDNYINAIMNLSPKLENFIKQNNAIDVYEKYYHDLPEMMPLEKPEVKIANLYRDDQRRPVSSLCWTLEEDPKLVVSYCSKVYPPKKVEENEAKCYLWALNISDKPIFELVPPCACWKLACSPANPALIVGGLGDGRVCLFDIRAGKAPISISMPHLAHREPVAALLYMQSRLNNEFFTGSSDGQCMWYDFRDLSTPLDSLIIAVRIPHGEEATLTNSEAVSAIEFERSFPTKFLCGTDSGLVISVNRKGKSHSEIMSAIFRAHTGPVRSVHRSPCTHKMFLTCGDWFTHIWSDDIKSSPIMTGMPHRYEIMDATWAPNRFSGYMTVSVDGKFRFWDLLYRFNKPWVSLLVSKNPLYIVEPHEDGRFVAMAGKRGTVYLAILSDNLMTSEPDDKQLVLQYYERGYRREHILEARIKEIRLKHRLDEEALATQTEVVPINEEALVREAEDLYRKQVIDEFRRIGYAAGSATQLETMRKR